MACSNRRSGASIESLKEHKKRRDVRQYKSTPGTKDGLQYGCVGHGGQLCPLFPRVNIYALT